MLYKSQCDTLSIDTRKSRS